MEAVLVTNSNSKEEFSVENVEFEGDLSNESISEAIEKVIIWFEKNDRHHSIADCLETLSIRSRDGSNADYDDIKTPSILSGSEYSPESSRKSYVKVKEYKAPVVPIELNHQDNYDVNIINFQSLDSFFVTIKREDDKRWNRLLRRLKKIQIKNRLEPLDEFFRGTPCLVEVDDELHRAIVQNSHARVAICFGIDTGKVYLVDTSRDFIYYMSPKIRNTVEFQAINCKLFDVRMPHDPEITKLVYEIIISKVRKPQIKVVKTKSSRFIDENCMSFNNYEVMLFGHNRTTSINQQIAFFIQGRKDYDLDNF